MFEFSRTCVCFMSDITLNFCTYECTSHVSNCNFMKHWINLCDFCWKLNINMKIFSFFQYFSVCFPQTNKKYSSSEHRTSFRPLFEWSCSVHNPYICPVVLLFPSLCGWHTFLCCVKCDILELSSVYYVT